MFTTQNLVDHPPCIALHTPPKSVKLDHYEQITRSKIEKSGLE